MDEKSMRVRAFGVVILVLCAAAMPAWARQDQNSSPYGSPDDAPASSQPAPNQQQDQQPAQQPDQRQGGDAAAAEPPQQEPQNAPAPSTAIVPAKLTLPEGTLISVRIGQW